MSISKHIKEHAILAGVPGFGLSLDFADGETPTGAIDSANTIYTLAHNPNPNASLYLFLNGVLQRQGTDYTIVDDTITYTVAPTTGDNHRAFYRY